MFSILQKPQEAVNAEDLETLQNEIEKRLADVVTHRWKLEQESDNLQCNQPSETNSSTNVSAPESSGPKSYSFSSSNQQPSGKLRNSLKAANQAAIEAIDLNSSDSTATTFMSINGGANSNNNNNNKHETESVSSESSLTSNLTGSTIITAIPAEPGSHNNQQTASIANHQISSLTNKRSLKNSTSDRPPKRFRPNGNSINQTQTKRLPHSKQQRAKTEESRPLKKQLIKNEAPDKLWPFVDQFCAAPSDAQIRDLEQMIEALENDKEYYVTPSSRQASNDTVTNSSQNSKEKGSQRKRAKGDNSLGALTQRLVSSFIEESDDSSKIDNAGGDPAPSPNKRNRSVSDVGNAKNLERKIRQLLEEYSILTQQDDIPYSSEEDEHSRQLRAYQHELLTIQAQNQHYMQILLKRAKRHIELEVEREKLRQVNADVIGVYQKFVQAKQRKRTPTKKEKDAALKAMKAHEAIYKKCDDLYLSNRLVRGRRDFPDL